MPSSPALPSPRLARLRRLRIALVTLGTLVAVPASLALRDAFFPTPVDASSIERMPSYQDRALLDRAWQLPVAAAYHPNLLFQPNGSVCGPTSIADVQRSLGQASASVDSVLAGSGRCWAGYCWTGLSLDELADVARHATGRKVTVLRDLSLARFRDELRRSNDPAFRYIVNFTRAPLFGRGGGHHSPLGGYLEREDLVLVLDVNDHFKPWLVSSERLFAAVDTTDSGKKRGLLRIE